MELCKYDSPIKSLQTHYFTLTWDLIVGDQAKSSDFIRSISDVFKVQRGHKHKVKILCTYIYLKTWLKLLFPRRQKRKKKLRNLNPECLIK
jgi:hypothetical protein